MRLGSRIPLVSENMPPCITDEEMNALPTFRCPGCTVSWTVEPIHSCGNHLPQPATTFRLAYAWVLLQVNRKGRVIHLWQFIDDHGCRRSRVGVGGRVWLRLEWYALYQAASVWPVKLVPVRACVAGRALLHEHLAVSSGAPSPSPEDTALPVLVFCTPCRLGYTPADHPLLPTAPNAS